MALKKETIDKLKKYGFDTDKLIAAITAEAEQDFDLPEVTVLTDAQLTERDNVKIGEGKKAGEVEARSTLVKELGKRLNLDLKGERLADVVGEIQTFVNKNGDEKVTMLQNQITALTTDKNQLTAKVTEFETNLSAAKFENELLGYFPVNRGTGLSDIERLTLIKSAINFEQVDGKYVAKRDGVVVTDPTTHAPLPIGKVIEGYFAEKPFLLGGQQAPTPSGRGAGDSNPGGAGGVTKLSQAEKAWLVDNPDGNIMSPEFTAYVDKIAKEDLTFDFYS
jgi:hypothetical protein